MMENRTCNKCGINQPIDNYYHSRRKGDKRTDERSYECKLCTLKRVKENHDPVRARDRHLRKKYGITLEQFNEMLEKQNGRCACCGTDKPGGKHNVFCVDHDHITGKVRELLCKDCNIVLGLVEDSPEHLQRLIEYIAKHTDD